MLAATTGVDQPDTASICKHCCGCLQVELLVQTRSVQAELAGEGSTGQAADDAAHPTAAQPQQVAGGGSSKLGAGAGAVAATPSAAEPQQRQQQQQQVTALHAEATGLSQHGLEVCRAATPSIAAAGQCIAAGHTGAGHSGPPAAAEMRTLMPGSGAESGAQRQAAGPAQLPQQPLQAERGPTGEGLPVVGLVARRAAQLSDPACPEGSLHGARRQAGAGSLGPLPAGPAQQPTAAVLPEAGQPLPGSRVGTQASSGVLAQAVPPVPAHPGSHVDGQLGSGVLAEAGPGGPGGFANPSSDIGSGRPAQGPLPGLARPGSRSASQAAAGVLAEADLPGPAHPGSGGSGGSSQLGSGILSGPPDGNDLSDEMDVQMAAQMEQAELAFQAKLKLPTGGREGSSSQAPGVAGVPAGSQAQPPAGGAVLAGAESHVQVSGAGPGGALPAATECNTGAAHCASRRGSPAPSGAPAAAAAAGVSSLQEEAGHAAAQQRQQQQQVQTGGPAAGILDDGFGASAFGDEEAFEAELAQLLAAADAPRGAGNPAAAGPPGPSGLDHHQQASQRASQQLQASQTLHGAAQAPAAGGAGPVSQVCAGGQKLCDGARCLPVKTPAGRL